MLDSFIECSKQHQNPGTGDSSNAQIPPSRMDTSKPDVIANSDVIYAQIEQNPKTVSGKKEPHANVTPQNDVIYSELQRQDAVADVVAPSNDL